MTTSSTGVKILQGLAKKKLFFLHESTDKDIIRLKFYVIIPCCYLVDTVEPTLALGAMKSQILTCMDMQNDLINHSYMTVLDKCGKGDN